MRSGNNRDFWWFYGCKKEIRKWIRFVIGICFGKYVLRLSGRLFEIGKGF